MQTRKKAVKEKEEVIEGFRKYSLVRRKEFDQEKDKEITNLNQGYAKSLSIKDNKIKKLNTKDLEEKRN